MQNYLNFLKMFEILKSDNFWQMGHPKNYLLQLGSSWKFVRMFYLVSDDYHMNHDMLYLVVDCH